MTPKNVRARRLKLGMTVEELAKAMRLPTATLARFELGEIELPNAESYRPILDRLEREHSQPT